MLYKNIAIEGNIGAGKTTLAKLLAKELKTSLLLEEFEDNEFLKEFYNNNQFALHAELQFVLHRSKQLHHFYNSNSKQIISDYMPQKSLLFAKQNLNAKDYMLIKNLINELLNQFPQPDLVIFLNRSVYDLKKNIEKRARDMESDISTDYLLKINKAYNQFLNQEHDFPILMINSTAINLNKKENVITNFNTLFHTKFEKGLHQIQIEE